jgi:hypothetical protein
VLDLLGFRCDGVDDDDDDHREDADFCRYLLSDEYMLDDFPDQMRMCMRNTPLFEFCFLSILDESNWLETKFKLAK